MQVMGLRKGENIRILGIYSALFGDCIDWGPCKIGVKGDSEVSSMKGYN